MRNYCKELICFNAWSLGATELKNKLLSSEGLLIIEPISLLEVSDFTVFAIDINPYIAEHGKLLGLLLHAKAFPGWMHLETAITHKKFINTHQKKIQKIAVVINNWGLRVMTKLAANFIQPKVRHFSESSYNAALQWLGTEMQ